MQARDYLNPFTDLALEATAAVRGDARTELPGVVVREERHDVATVSWVQVLDGIGEQTIGKPAGNYVTIDARPAPPAQPGACRRRSERSWWSSWPSCWT